jgi:hypothetical protein
MNLNLRHRAVCSALLLLLIGASGCTNSDILTPTTDTVTVEVDVSNVPVEFRFDTSRFRVRQIVVSPADPSAEAVLGTERLGFMQETFTLNYNVLEPVVRTFPLATGTYRLDQIIINNINFRDLEAPPDPAPPDVTCADYIAEYRSRDDGVATITNFGRDILIDIRSGEDNFFRITVDWAVFTEALQTAWACQQGFLCDPGEIWCLVEPFGLGFNESTFNDFAPDIVTIN